MSVLGGGCRSVLGGVCRSVIGGVACSMSVVVCACSFGSVSLLLFQERELSLPLALMS